MSGGEGIASAVAQAMAEAGPMAAPVKIEQLLPLGDALAIEAARDGRADRNAGHAVEAVRAAGRPKGATNKRTAAWRDYLLSKYAHPLEVLAQAYSRPVETLAAELGCTKLEAFTAQVKAAAELAPFIESKMPIGVAVDARGTISLVIHGADSGEAVEGGSAWGLSAMLQNQGVDQ
ncbi:MAG: hypothetical protein ACOYLS_01370 [Polymorphobacter sp.]